MNRLAFDIPKMCPILRSLRVLKLTGKPAFLTIADSQSEAPRIQFVQAAWSATDSNAFRIQSGLLNPAFLAAWSICRASGGAIFTAMRTAFASFLAFFGLPTLFFIKKLTKSLYESIILVNHIGNIKVDMANILKFEKKVSVVSILSESSSIHSIERITGVNRNRIMSLGVRVGTACKRIMDEKF